MDFLVAFLLIWAVATVVALLLIVLLWPRRWRGLRVWRMVRISLWARRR